MNVMKVTKGQETRRRILDAAQASILAKGFGATSIEEIIAETGLTKSGFFYHFRDKNELARALLERHMEDEARLYDELIGKARELVDDPLQVLLLTLKLLADTLADMPNGYPGCLVATFCYQERLFDREVRELNREAVLLGRDCFRGLFDSVLTRYRPRDGVIVEELADLVSTVIEGAIVLSKALGDPESMRRQIMAFRALIQASFTPRPEG